MFKIAVAIVVVVVFFFFFKAVVKVVSSLGVYIYWKN